MAEFQTGNIPLDTKDTTETRSFFNNYFEKQRSVSSNVNDAVLAYFETLTGDKDSAKVLAATVIYTAQSQGVKPMEIIDEFQKMTTTTKVKVRTPYHLPVITAHETFTDIEENKTSYSNGQLFYLTDKKVFFQLTVSGENYTLNSTRDYEAEFVNVAQTGGFYNFYSISYKKDNGALNAYLTMFLNINRVGTSLLGISNVPPVSKYISRAILP